MKKSLWIFLISIFSVGISAGTINPVNTLWPNSAVMSDNGQFQLIMQTDGNLVLYNKLDNTVRWTTNTRSAGSRAVMQADGNFVVYDPNNRPLWSTGTAGYPNSYFLVSDQGGLYMFSIYPAWYTKTAATSFVNSQLQPSTLSPGQVLHSGAAITSGNGGYRLIMQSDGNLVLYQINVSPWKVLWATYTSKAGSWAVMQGDGNFVVYDPANKPVWASNTVGKRDAYLAVQDDGNLVVYATKTTYQSKTSNYEVSQGTKPKPSNPPKYLCPNGTVTDTFGQCPTVIGYGCDISWDGSHVCGFR